MSGENIAIDFMIYGATNNPLRPLIGEIKALAALGFDYLELCLDPPHCVPEMLRPSWPKLGLSWTMKASDFLLSTCRLSLAGRCLSLHS